MKKLRQEYKKIKDNHNQTGTGRTKWKFYERLAVYLFKKSVFLVVVLLNTRTEKKFVNLCLHKDDLAYQLSGIFLLPRMEKGL